jgi:hypothetical protein
MFICEIREKKEADFMNSFISRTAQFLAMQSRIILSLFFLLAAMSCNTVTIHQEDSKTHADKEKKKPGSSFADTMRITGDAAVFFNPDSLQLKKIQEITEPGIFQSTMHEFFYQQKNAHNFLKNQWPNLKVIEAKNIRYVLFREKNWDNVLIDLDQVQDACGLIIFHPSKTPLHVDMMNVETQVSEYFKVY